MRKKEHIFVIGILVSMFLLYSASFSIAAVPPANPVENFASQPVPNQIIVKYKKDLSPQTLQLKADERKVQQSGFFGSIRIFFDNLKYKAKKQEVPEKHLTRIQEADKEVGAENKERLFDAGDENQRNTFLIKTDGKKTIEEVIRVYEALPEVEYAEPNYVYTTFGVE